MSGQTCQACGGEVQGWICQGCGRTFREAESGSLIFDRLVTEPEAQPPGDGFQLSSEERAEADSALADLAFNLASDLSSGHFGMKDAIMMIEALATRLAALSRKERESAASPVQPSRAGEGELRKAFADFVDAIERAPISWETGVCCCGNLVEGHGFGDGHSPVDEGVYFISGAIKDAKAALRTNPEGEG